MMEESDFTFAQSAVALPVLGARRLPAGLPKGQVVLVVGSHPRWAHHGSHIQAERQEDAHQPDQFERRQRGAARRLLRLCDSGRHCCAEEKPMGVLVSVQPFQMLSW